MYTSSPFKLITNRWAWELVPKGLWGAKSCKLKGGIHGNPRTGNHPKRRTKLTNSLEKQQLELSTRTWSGHPPWNRGKFVSQPVSSKWFLQSFSLFWVGRYNKTLNDWSHRKQWVSFPWHSQCFPRQSIIEGLTPAGSQICRSFKKHDLITCKSIVQVVISLGS